VDGVHRKNSDGSRIGPRVTRGTTYVDPFVLWTRTAAPDDGVVRCVTLSPGPCFYALKRRYIAFCRGYELFVSSNAMYLLSIRWSKLWFSMPLFWVLLDKVTPTALP
jgi:hypothetical protein